MQVLITGAKGMLGRTLCRTLKGFELIETDRDTMDITDARKVEEMISRYSPEVVVHCAAMTTVDLCESKRDLAYKINAVGTANVASACYRNGVRLIAISTDYVFDGTGDQPYSEYDVATGGRTVYGQSKFAGEEAVRTLCPNHVIGRVAWLYGAGGPSFVHTMLRLADGSRSVLKVVNDQIGNPTSTDAVARAVQVILDYPEITGTFHLTCEGEATWYEFAEKIFELRGVSQTVAPCTSSEYLRPAPRPTNSRLEKMNLRLYGLPAMPKWDEELRRVLEQPGF